MAATASTKPSSVNKQTAQGDETDAVHTYLDFVITLKRKSIKQVEVNVHSSIAGSLSQPCFVSFTAKREIEIKESFRPGGIYYGLFNFTRDHAIRLGKELSTYLLPPPVFYLFTESLSKIFRTPGMGLRIRLALDTSLIDLPWEYIYRPDSVTDAGISGFVLLDPTISIVRELPNPRISIKPATGKQQLVFAGTFWENNKDGWEVKKEFDLISAALKPVSKYITPVFRKANSKDAFKINNKNSGTIFHYAGHCDFDSNGNSCLVRELPGDTSKPGLGEANYPFIEKLAKTFYQSGTRLVVLSACNSGFWPMVKPFLMAEVPAVIGINGIISSESTIEFCKKLYESLAVGLSLDEAVGRARLHVLTWDDKYNFFDWGLYMIYMTSPEAVLFPQSGALAAKAQVFVRAEHEKTARQTIQHAREIDGMNFSEIMSHTSKKRVLILGRFNQRRLKILELIKQNLLQHPNNYIAELYTYQKPEKFDLVQSVRCFALLSKFIIADISEASAIQTELMALTSLNLSVPIIPIIVKKGKVYTLFSHVAQSPNVAKPIITYLDEKDVTKKLNEVIIPIAEEMYASISL